LIHRRLEPKNGKTVFKLLQVEKNQNRRYNDDSKKRQEAGRKI
jgi:hypothetical protein